MFMNTMKNTDSTVMGAPITGPILAVMNITHVSESIMA